ncbi:MAG: FadR/GntR family transcriptional regulator [Betaproteobacteria bacterium]
MPLQVIESQRLYRQIAEQLRELVARGEFKRGARLPAERDLAHQLGVSRPSVREALIALEVEGIIEVRTGSGIYIRRTEPSRAAASLTDASANEWGPLEVMSARLVIESEVAALAARNADKSHLKAMHAALREMQDEVEQGQVPRWGDEAFHEAIAGACGNSVLLDTVKRLWQARNGPLFERLGAYFEHPASWQAAIAEHRQVLSAIESRNSSAARRAMQKHLKQAHKRYSASWRRAPSS